MSAPPEYQFPNVRNQYMAAIAANIMFLCHGNMIGWIAPALPLLLSNETPLKTGPLTNEQMSWIGSMSAFGGIIGNLAFGFITVFLGCKRSMLLLTLPTVTFWTLIYFGDTFHHIMLARLANGLTGGGVQSIIILYITEIANNNVRGRLGSFSHLSRNVGILFAYILGAIFQYEIVACISVVIPIIFTVWFTLLPNTPQYHFRNGQLKKAEDALRFYKGCKGGSFAEYIVFSAEFERLKSMATKQMDDEKTHLGDFLNRAALKGMSNGIILASLAHFTGYLVFIVYAVLIFKESGVSDIDPYISSITLAVLQLIGNLCTTYFSDSLGRKILLIISLLGSALGMFAFALYSYLKHNGFELLAFEWVPVTTLSFVICIASAGVVPLMFVCTVEQLPTKIRTVGISICNIFVNAVSFGLLKLFPIFIVIIGLHGCMAFLATSCVVGSLYVYFIVEETKGISLDNEAKDRTEGTTKADS